MHNKGLMVVGRLGSVALLALVLMLIWNVPSKSISQEDPEQILFESQRDGNSEIYLMNADGTDVQNLTQNEAVDNFAEWSPDGEQIVFLSNRDHENGDIYLMNADGSDVRNITHNEAPERNPQLSPDGRLMVYLTIENGFEFYIVDIENGRRYFLTVAEDTDNCAKWSPDGTQLAVYADFTVAVINADATGYRWLSDSAGTCPAWSPDGERIAFAEMIEGSGGVSEIYTIKPDGTDKQLISSELEAEEIVRLGGITWSPDGRYMAFSGLHETHVDVWALEVATGTIAPIDHTEFDESRPSWSRDGKQLAFQSDRNGDWEIFVLERGADSEGRNISNHEAFDYSGRFRP